MLFENCWPALCHILRGEEVIKRVVVEVADAAHRGHLLVRDAPVLQAQGHAYDRGEIFHGARYLHLARHAASHARPSNGLSTCTSPTPSSTPRRARSAILCPPKLYPYTPSSWPYFCIAPRTMASSPL
eukprot:764205-Pleurochrysis_carterae.AAC.1